MEDVILGLLFNKNMKTWKIQAYNQASNEIVEIEDNGHKVIRFNDYHWRIDNEIDIWPSTKKFMKNGQVKKYSTLKEIF